LLTLNKLFGQKNRAQRPCSNLKILSLFLAKAKVINGDLTDIVTSVAERTGSISELDVAISRHEADYWFEER